MMGMWLEELGCGYSDGDMAVDCSGEDVVIGMGMCLW